MKKIVQITDRNMFLLETIDLRYCYVVSREMRGEVATLNSCYNDDVLFSGYKWCIINGSTIFDRRFSSIRRSVEELITDQVGANWKVYLIFTTNEFLEFISKWLKKRDNVLGDIKILPPTWNDEIPEKDPRTP